jgi:hypothetical protein
MWCGFLSVSDLDVTNCGTDEQAELAVMHNVL